MSGHSNFGVGKYYYTTTHQYEQDNTPLTTPQDSLYSKSG
jgi:hypothetical protein